MSDEAVLDQLSISQSMRFYWYRYKMPPPIPPVSACVDSLVELSLIVLPTMIATPEPPIPPPRKLA